MQKYITSFCGVCEQELSFEVGASAFCGTTHIECNKCGTLNKTNYKPYSEMIASEVVNGIFKNFVFDIIFIGSLFLFIVGIYIGRYDDTFTLGSAFVFLIYNGIKFILLKNNINEVEIKQKRINDLIEKRKG